MSKQEIMYSHVADWQSSGLTQSSYCKNVGIKLATFSYWVIQYKKETVQEATSSFIAIKAKDLFPEEFFKQFKTGDELQNFLKDLQKRGIEKC